MLVSGRINLYLPVNILRWMNAVKVVDETPMMKRIPPGFGGVVFWEGSNFWMFFCSKDLLITASNGANGLNEGGLPRINWKYTTEIDVRRPTVFLLRAVSGSPKRW